MKHEKIKELLPLYIDNELSDQEENLIADHLQNCEECQEKLQQYQKNQNLLSALKKERAPADFTESILNKINKDKKEKQSNKDNNENPILKRIKDFFTSSVRVPAGVISLVAIILLVSITGLPGTLLKENGPLTNEFQTKDKSLNYGKQQSQYTPNTQSVPKTKMKLEESTRQKDHLIIDSSKAEFEQKIIKRANLSIELKDIDKINNQITNLVKEYKGYVSNSRNWVNHNKQKFYRFELRVPTEKFNQLLDQLSTGKYGQIISRSISKQDVTEEYMDLNVRLDNLLSQEERYRQLLNKATEVEEILKIENELNRIRTQIERLQGRKKYLDNQISYSTISVEFRQPEPLNSGTLGILRAIKNAINNMIDQFYQIIILIGTIIPYLLLFGIGYLIYKKFIRN